MPSSAQTDSAQTDRVMAAAQAAQQVKHACTIDEAELLALRPTLLKGYASLQDNSRLAVASFQQMYSSMIHFFGEFVLHSGADGPFCTSNGVQLYGLLQLFLDFWNLKMAPVRDSDFVDALACAVQHMFKQSLSKSSRFCVTAPTVCGGPLQTQVLAIS